VIRLGNAKTSRLTLKYFWNKNAPDRYGKALGLTPKQTKVVKIHIL